MATSKCPVCQKTSFETVENTPRNSKYIVMFVQCASCGSVVGVLESYNIGNLIYKLADKLGIDLDR